MVFVIHAEVSDYHTRSIAWARTIVLILPAIAFLTVISILVEGALRDPEVALNMQRVFVVLPLGVATGFYIFRSRSSGSYVRVFVGWAVVASIGATVEYTLNRSLLGREEMYDFTRDGHVRAMLASEHPLVLGTILAACIPLVLFSGLRWPRFITVVLLSGSYSTGSRAPTILAAAFFLLQFIPGAISFTRSRYRAARLACIAALITLLSFAFFVWVPVIPGSSGGEYSTQYRSAIYSFLPRILEEAPFGYGFGAIPVGRWLIHSELRGVLDLARTVDSELVYLALGFGVVGVAAFSAVVYLGVASMRYNYAISASCTVINAAGIVLALHAWDSIGPFWYILIGGAWWAIVEGRSLPAVELGNQLRPAISASRFRGPSYDEVSQLRIVWRDQ
jgi:hypothetical protein